MIEECLGRIGRKPSPLFARKISFRKLAFITSLLMLALFQSLCEIRKTCIWEVLKIADCNGAFLGIEEGPLTIPSTIGHRKRNHVGRDDRVEIIWHRCFNRWAYLTRPAKTIIVTIPYVMQWGGLRPQLVVPHGNASLPDRAYIRKMAYKVNGYIGFPKEREVLGSDFGPTLRWWVDECFGRNVQSGEELVKRGDFSDHLISGVAWSLRCRWKFSQPHG
jgi:hypothetical protein